VQESEELQQIPGVHVWPSAGSGRANSNLPTKIKAITTTMPLLMVKKIITFFLICIDINDIFTQ
jgi:hypothetical protein